MLLKSLEDKNLGLKIDPYFISYLYVYVIKTKMKQLTLNHDAVMINSIFDYNSYTFIIFYLKSDIDSSSLLYKYPRQTYKIYKFLTKHIDILVAKPSNRWPMKTILHIQSSFLKDMIDDYFSKDATVKISSPLLNVVTSNKLIYYQYFIDHGIITNTKIKHLTRQQIIKCSKKYVVKAPYSSVELCVQHNDNVMNPHCYIADGVIVARKHESVQNFEVKIHTCKGHVMYVVIKSQLQKNPLHILNSHFQDRDGKIPQKLKPYIEILTKMCHEIYHKMNKLLCIIQRKIVFEYKNFIRPYKLHTIKCLSLNTYHKRKYLQDKNMTEYLNFLKLSIKQLEARMTEKIDPAMYSDWYFRMDFMLPDNHHYKTVTLNEIEPYACGKQDIDSIRSSVDVFGTDKSTIKTSHDLVFLKIFQTLLNGQPQVLKPV